MIKMSRKAKKAMAVALTAGMLASTAATPVMAATEGWKKNSTGWWYQNADGSWPASKWEKINGSWYYFDANGYMKANSWAQDKAGKWYYVGADGAMKTNSWAQDKKGLWYYVGNDGAMVTNTWEKDKAGLWYFLGADGVMEAGKWITVGGKNYFLAADGVMQSGVITVEGKTYYLGASNDGAMKTGEQNVAGTKYNFGKDGVCTDEKAPAANKHFDKNGNEITPEIEVEQVAGMTAEITNALPAYKETYGNVLFAGKDAYLKVLVTDDNGKPVANTAVSVMSKHKIGSSDDFGLKGLNVQSTDAYGYATFVIGAKDDEITPTSGEKALITLTVTAVSTNQSKEIDLSFASIDTGVVDVINHNDHYDSLFEKTSTNAVEKDHNIAYTKTIGGKKPIEYVFSQQVSNKGADTNRVEIAINPQIEIPVIGAEKEVSTYHQEVNKEIKEYSVYQDGSKTSFKIENIPAGLEYADLNFSTINLSEYTRVQIETYKAGTTDLIKTYTLEGPRDQKDFAYQLPVQKDVAIDVIVKVLSEGQVDDDQNAGLVVKDVTGLYAKDEGKDHVYIPMENSVTWTKVTNKYSEVKPLDEKTAKAYIPAGIEAKYTADGNKYTYQVPVYPYTGNAVMTVTDSNKKVVGYFTIPTENVYKTTDVAKPGYQNENDIIKEYVDGVLNISSKNKAVLVSKDEAFNNVGSIETKGNKVVVNSEETGVTALQAKITLPGFEDEIDLTEDTVYTSVQWAPIPNSVEANSQFYALVGQNVTVKAQLVDKNGNAVSGNKDNITFKYAVSDIPDQGATIGETSVTVIHKDATADANGQAVLKLNAGSELALLKSLEASSSGYDVVLTIGDKTVEKADLRWVAAGLAFTTDIAEFDSKNVAQNPNYVKIDSFGNKVGSPKAKEASVDETLTKILAKDTGSNWIFGYEVVGITQDGAKQTETKDTTREVISIEGLKVELSKSADGEIVTDGMANGTAKLKSTKNGATRLTGTINQNSLVSGTDVIFNIDTNGDGTPEQYKNVGEGVPSIDTSLELPITWGIVGEQLSLVSTKGSSFVVNNGDQVYVKVADEFGGAIANKFVDVTVTYTLIDGTTEVYKANGTGALTGGATSEKLESNENGLIPITLKNQINAANDISSVTITAKYGNVTLVDGNVITYKNKGTVMTDFALASAKYDITSGANGTIELTFSTPVNSSSVMKDMFELEGTVSGKLVVSKAEVNKADNTKVILTLDDVNPSLEKGEEIKVTVNGKKVVDGVTYTLCDKNGKSITTTDGKNVVVCTTSSKTTTLNYEYQTTDATKINVSCNNVVANQDNQDNQDFRVVYSGSNDLISGMVNAKGIKDEKCSSIKLNDTTSADGIIITLNPSVVADGDITIYHNGGSVVITKETLNKKAAAEAQKTLNIAAAAGKLSVPTVTLVPTNGINAPANVAINSIPGCKVSAIVVDQTSGSEIFAPVTTGLGGLELTTKALSTSVTENVVVKVKVTYTNTNYPTVKVTKSYTATYNGATLVFVDDDATS